MTEIEDLIILLLKNEDTKAKSAIKSVKNEDKYTNEYLNFFDIFIKRNFDRCKQVISHWDSVSLRDSEKRDRYFCIQQVLKLMTYKALKETQHINNIIKEITTSQSINSIYSKKFKMLTTELKLYFCKNKTNESFDKIYKIHL